MLDVIQTHVWAFVFRDSCTAYEDETLHRPFKNAGKRPPLIHFRVCVPVLPGGSHCQAIRERRAEGYTGGRSTELGPQECPQVPKDNHAGKSKRTLQLHTKALKDTLADVQQNLSPRSASRSLETTKPEKIWSLTFNSFSCRPTEKDAQKDTLADVQQNLSPRSALRSLETIRQKNQETIQAKNKMR